MSANTKPAKNFREFERENEDVKKAEHLKLPLNRISVKQGFNPRDLQKPETQAKIAELQAAYEAGDFVPLPIVRMAMDGNTAEIVDGECRYTAACRADKAMRERGEKGITEYEVIRFTGTERQARSLSFKANQGEHLTPIEQADHTIWYREDGCTREEIAKELNKSVGWIDRLIVISKLPDDVKALVRANKIAAEEAVKYHKKHGEKAYEEIMAALDKAAGKGETKVTPKHEQTAQNDAGGENEGEDEGSVTAAQKAEQEAAAKAAAKALKKRQEAQAKTARDLAFALPDKIKKPRNIVDTEMYPVELTGAAIKLMLQLQDKFTPEIEEAIAAERAGVATPQQKAA
jgi:hypothetical protein